MHVVHLCEYVISLAAANMLRRFFPKIVHVTLLAKQTHIIAAFWPHIFNGFSTSPQSAHTQVFSHCASKMRSQFRSVFICFFLFSAVFVCNVCAMLNHFDDAIVVCLEFPHIHCLHMYWKTVIRLYYNAAA